MIARFLGNLLAIKPSEWDSVVYFFLVLLLFSFGASFARSISMTLLIEKLGGEQLPVMYIFIDLAVMIGSLLYAHYTKKVSGLAILGFLFLATAFFSVFVQLLFFLNNRKMMQLPWSYGFFFVGFFFFYILISIHIGSVVASYFTAVQVKRLTAVINAGIPIGGVLGGSSLIVLLNIFHFQPQQLVVILGWACLAAFGLLQLVNMRLSPVRTGSPIVRGPRNPLREWLAAFKYLLYSKLMIFMSLALMLFVIGNKLLEYEYQTLIYYEFFPQTQQRATFFATYEVFANLTWLLIQLLLTSRIIVWLGVGASNVLYPALSAMAALALFVYFYWHAQDHGAGSEVIMLSLGIFAQFINQEMRGALRTPANNLLFNAIPPNLWGINKAFLNGIVFPLSTVIASSFLIVITGSSDPLNSGLSDARLSYVLPLIVLFVSVVGILVALPQWAAYNQGVFGLLNRDLFERRLPFGSGKSHSLRQVIAQKLNSHDPYPVIAALEMIRVLRLNYFINTVGNLLLKSAHLTIKEHCINTLAALPQSSTNITYLSEALKLEQDPKLLALILKQLTAFKTVHINNLVEPLQHHPDPNVSVHACLYLHQHSPLHRQKALEQLLLKQLHQASNAHLTIYLEAVGALQHPEYATEVLPYLDQEQPQVRVAAFSAYIYLLQGQLDPHKDLLLQALKSHNKEMKLVALRALKECHLETPEHWHPIISLLGAKDRTLVHESKELLRLSLSACKPALIECAFAEQVSVPQRFEVLSLIYPKLSEAQKRTLHYQAEKALKRFVQLMGLLKWHQTLAVESQVYELIAKLLQELAEEQLLQVLTIITFASGQNLEFFHRVGRGLLSLNRAQQGNALEVLSNAGERHLVAKILKFFDERLTDAQAISRIHQLLFGSPWRLTQKIYQDYLTALNHDMLKACLIYQQFEKSQQWMLTEENGQVKQLLLPVP